MAAPTREDGHMLIELAQLSTSLGVMEAMPSIFAEDFDPETADVMDRAVRTMLGFGELIGTLVKHDLISAELVHDWLWLGGVWQRVGPAALRQREQMGEPRLYENFEALV
jgi:hypothetical protein